MKFGRATYRGAVAGRSRGYWRVALAALLLLGCRDGLTASASSCGVLLRRLEPADPSGPGDGRLSLFRPSDGLLAKSPEEDGAERFHLFPATEPDHACLNLRDAGAPAPGPSRPRPDPRLTRLVTVGSLATVVLVEYALWWKNGKRTDFQFVNEGWFDRGTYAGGADKASHFVGGFIGTKILEAVYRAIGHSPSEARAPAALVVIAEGVLIELGDSFKGGGFSWQDIGADTVGALSAWEIGRRGWDDVIGVRWGQTGTSVPSEPGTSVRSPYSNEMYLLDAKLNGVFRRLGRKPGLARFLLVSASYETKGYALSPPDQRQRNLGIELGPNFPEILRAIGVRDDSWWGKPLLALLTYYRPPLTTLGIRYDFNARRWRGPDAGNKPY